MTADWQLTELTVAQRRSTLSAVVRALRTTPRDEFTSSSEYTAAAQARFADGPVYIAGFSTTSGDESCPVALTYNADKQAWYLAPTMRADGAAESRRTVEVECRTATSQGGWVGANAFGVRRLVRRQTITKYAVSPKGWTTEPAGAMMLTGYHFDRVPFAMPLDEARRLKGRLAPYILFRPVPDAAGEVVATEVVPFRATISDPTEGTITKRRVLTDLVAMVLVDKLTGKVVARSAVNSEDSLGL